MVKTQKMVKTEKKQILNFLMNELRKLNSEMEIFHSEYNKTKNEIYTEWINIIPKIRSTPTECNCVKAKKIYQFIYDNLIEQKPKPHRYCAEYDKYNFINDTLEKYSIKNVNTFTFVVLMKPKIECTELIQGDDEINTDCEEHQYNCYCYFKNTQCVSCHCVLYEKLHICDSCILD